MDDQSSGITPRDVEEVPIAQLYLDRENPRFAGMLGTAATQEELLNFIADSIGIKDLLSSMSKGGYYRSSPLVGLRQNSSVIIVEGNRRLAAALILAQDPRAKEQRTRAANYPVDEEALRSLGTLPVLIASNRREVLPYLGVAHIVGTKKWDSYAKAAWAADVLRKGVYPGGLGEIADLIGDQHRTLERMVEAFTLINRLKDTGRFDPEDSTRTGRGSAEFPFSWVYTALGYNSIRNWIGLPSGSSDRTETGILSEAEDPDRAAILLKWMFGSDSEGTVPLLSDSRQIADLAAAVTDERQLTLLRAGIPLEEARAAVRPPQEKLLDALLAAHDALRDVLGLLGSSGADLPASSLPTLEAESLQVARAANTAYKQLRELSNPALDLEA